MEGNTEFDDIDELADDDNKKKVPQPKSRLCIDALAIDLARVLAVIAIRRFSSRLKYPTSRGSRPKKFLHVLIQTNPA